MSVPEKIPLSELSRGDLEALTERLLAENAALKQVVADLRAGIVRLKGVTGGPAIRPSGAEDRADGQDRQAWRQTAQNWSLMQLVIDEERVIKVDGVALQGLRGLHRSGSGAAPACPPGALAHARRALAPMPAGVAGHFGPELRRFVLLQYHQGQVTMPRLVGQLRAIGIVISKRQVGSTRRPLRRGRRAGN